MGDQTGGPFPAPHAARDLLGHPVQPREVASDVQVGILLPRDQEGGVPQIDRVVRQRQQGGERLARLPRILHPVYLTRSCRFG